MPETLQLPPSEDISSPPQTDSTQVLTRKNVNKYNSPKLDKSKLATLKHTTGYDVHRSRPKETLDYQGNEIPLKRESEMTSELVDRFTDSMHNSLERLINIRKDYTTDADFQKFLNDSGHSYYVELFSKLVQEKPQTNGRVLEIDQKALENFMSFDKGLAVAYRIRQQEMQEQALAAAIALSINPDEPENVLPAPDDVDLGGSGALKKPLRKAQHWWHTKTGTVHGRPKERGAAAKLLVDTNGRLVLTMAGANVAGALVSGVALGSVLGPAGAIIGPAAVNAFAALKHSLRSGEVMKREDISADALRTLLGDPDSHLPTKQHPDRPKINWMKEFHHIDPEDYTFDAGGKIIRRDRISQTRVNLTRLVEDLKGHANDILAFQEQDDIPLALQRTTSSQWILEGSRNAPTHNTPAEARIMKLFDANNGGIQDKNGNTIEITDYIRGADEPRHAEIVTTERRTEYAVDAQFHFKAGELLPEGQTVPDYTDPIGNRIAAHPAAPGERAFDDFNAPRVFRRGDPIPVGTVIPQHHDVNGRLIPEERINWRGAYATFEFDGLVRFLPGQTIPAETYIPAHLGPGNYALDTAHNRIPIQVKNPYFEWDNLDIAGNAERWMNAEEAVLKEEINEVFQSIVDGKTDHLILFKDRLDAAKKGHRSGAMVEAERKKLTKEKAALGKDDETLTAENETLIKFQKTIVQKRSEISRLQQEQESILLTISVSGNPDLLASLQKVLGDGDGTTTVTIDGQSISSINADRQVIKDKIRKEVDATYKAKLAQATSNYQDIMTEAMPSDNIGKAELRERRARFLSIKSSLEDESNQYEAKVRKSYEQDFADVEARRKLITDAQQALVKGVQTIRAAQRQLLSSDLEGKQNAGLVLGSMDKAFDKIKGWNIPATGTFIKVDETTLATASYSDLEAAINNANATPDKGWPKDTNTLADNRILLLHAIAEARAKVREPAVQTTNSDLSTLIDPNTYGFSELDLYGMTDREIFEAILEKRGTNPGLSEMDIDKIRTVKDAVNKRIGARQTAINQILIDLDTREGKTAEALSNLTERGLSAPQIDAIDRAYGRFGPITEKFMDQMPEQADVDKFFAIKITSGTATCDEAAAYKNIMDLIFNHKQDYNVSYGNATGPDAALARNGTVLTQKELTSLMITHFGLAASGSSLGGTLVKIREMDQKRLANFFSTVVILEHFESKIP